MLWIPIKTHSLIAGGCCTLGFSPSVSDGQFNSEERPHHLRSDGERQWPRHDLVDPHHPVAAAGGGGRCRALLQQELPTTRHKAVFDLDREQVADNIILILESLIISHTRDDQINNVKVWMAPIKSIKANKVIGAAQPN